MTPARNLEDSAPQFSPLYRQIADRLTARLDGGEWKPGEAIEVDATGLGWTLMHRSIFEKIDPPWFRTLAEVTPEGGGRIATQDIFFAGRLLDYKKKTGEDIRWLLDTSVRVGHLSADGRIF